MQNTDHHRCAETLCRKSIQLKDVTLLYRIYGEWMRQYGVETHAFTHAQHTQEGRYNDFYAK